MCRLQSTRPKARLWAKAISSLGMVCALLSISACAPFWPRVKPDEAGEIEYVSILSDIKTTQADKSTTALPTESESAHDKLVLAQEFARNTAVEFVEQSGHIVDVRNAETLGLAGLGTAAGVTLVHHPTAGNLLRNLGLAAASAVGLDSALGVDSQHAIFAAGTLATYCLIRVDSSLDAITTANLLDNRTRTTMATNFADASLPEFDVHSEVPSVVVEQLLGPRIQKEKLEFAEQFDSSREFAQKMNAYNAIGTLTLANVAKQSLQAFVLASASVSDETARARNLADGVFKIRTVVANELFESRDITKVFASMRDGLKKIAEEVVQAKITASTDVARAKAAPAPVDLDSNRRIDVSSILVLSILADDVLPKADPVQKEYDDCIAQATVPAEAPGSQ